MASGLFDNLRALFTSLGSSERQELETIWEKNGGKVAGSVTPNDPPHVVITRRVGSAKYVSLMRRHPNTHVVPPEWIRKSVDMNKKQPYSQFRVGCLYGLRICLSGFDVDKKASLAELITRNGGTHSPSLTKFCTHLVSSDRKTQKYTFAMKHGIVCCSLDWLEESTTGRVKWCRDATKYPVKDKEFSLVISHKPDGGELESSAGGNTDNAPRLNSAREDVRDTTARHKNSASQRNNSREDSDRGESGDGAREVADAGEVGRGGAVDVGKVGSDTRKEGYNNEEALQPDEDLDVEPTFLKECGIWYTSLSNEEFKELVSLCCKSGATRISFPHPTLVTHIVQGSEPRTRGELNDVSRAMRSSINPPRLVNMEWLRASVRSRRALDADQARFQPPKDDDAARIQSTGLNYKRVTERSDNGRSMQVTLNMSLIQDQSNTNEASNSSLGLRGDGMFSGYYFTLCAIRGTGEERIAEVLIRQHGGKINNTSMPTSGEGTLLAICPSSLTRIDASRLRAQTNNNFGYVPEDNRFTLYWIQCCVKAQKMLMHQDGAPCFRPLPFELPMDGVSNLSVSTSGYDDDIKLAIKHTVETIGGRFSAKNMSAKDSHLIVPFAHGEKYRHSERLGVIPVTSQWLVESVKAGRILPEARFRPGPRPGCEPDAMAQGTRLGPVEATQHAWDAKPVNHSARVATPAERPPVFDQQQFGDVGGARDVSNFGNVGSKAPSAERSTQRQFTERLAREQTRMKPVAKKLKSQPGAIDPPVGDDLEKAGLQVTSLISKLQASPQYPATTKAPAGENATKARAARPAKRASSRRVGLNQSENDKGLPSAGEQDEDGQMNFDAMVEVSQRVGYE